MMRLDKQETIELIEKHLLSVIREYHSTRVIGKFPVDDRLILKKVWENGLGNTNMNLMCPSCIKYGLDVVGSWYDKHKVEQIVERVELFEKAQELLESEEPSPRKNKGGRPRKNKD